MWQKSYDGSPSMYVIPTPIGNLDDITKRAVDILNLVDVIFSEDTRVTLQLLNYLKIKKQLIHLDDHNELTVREKLLEYLKQGCNVGLVTDRGTPIISDPGFKTVKYIKENGFNVITLPGPCAFVPALVSSSISSEHFLFYGFLSSKLSKMKSELLELKDFKYTIVFYESPHRIQKTLQSMLEILGDRLISISKEISKLHESVYLGKISQAIDSDMLLKGEFVIVVSPDESKEVEDISIIDEVNKYIGDGYSSMDAIKKVAKRRNIPKNQVYSEFHRGDKE